MKEELIIDSELYCGNQDDFDAIKEAIKRLSSVSEEQFESIKKEKWYNRVFNMVTFSQKGKKRLAEQVGKLAQAQQILVELLLRLSDNDSNISGIVAESMEDIRRIQKQNIHLLSRIKRLENITLGIKTDFDIRKLSETEKKVLCACLYKISEKGNSSEAQKAYANAVFKYLDVDAQMDNPTAALEEMNDDSRRKILGCCLEYIFLKDCSEKNYDEYEDFISEFDVGNKSMNAIKKQIISLCNLRGDEGFYSKYQKENYEEIEDTFEFDFEDEIDDETELEVETEPEVEMTDEYISSILQIRDGETKTFQYKNIHISAYINCEGELKFDHCKIYYNESDAGDEITLASGAKLAITNSEFICKGYDQKAFISNEWAGNVVIAFDNTNFEDCVYFIDSRECDFSMTNCRLHNCYEKFIEAGCSSCEISNNIII